jgi:hypothetical protein
MNMIHPDGDNFGLVLCSFLGQCQHFRETCCLHLQGWSDKAGKWRAYTGFEEGRVRERGQSETRNMGQEPGGTGTLRAGYRQRRGWIQSEVREELAFFRDHQKASGSCSKPLIGPFPSAFLPVNPPLSQPCHFSPEDGDSMFLWNTSINLQNHRRQTKHHHTNRHAPPPHTQTCLHARTHTYTKWLYEYLTASTLFMPWHINW